MDAELATYYEREVTTVQGSRALQCLLEYVDVILSVYTQEPADEREASALVETYGLFFDASRASRAYEWSPELRPRVEKTLERIQNALTGAVTAGGTRAVTAGLAWIAWRAGHANQLEGNAGLKTEYIQLLERLRRDRVPVSETRVRELF